VPALAIPSTAGSRPAHWAAVGALARTANDGLLIATAIVAVIFSTIQWSTPSIIGVDGYYHIKISWLMLQQGWRILFPVPFPWMQLTVLNPAEFTDHHLLFHLLLAPFTLIDLRIGAKLAAVVFASSALLVMYQLMAENRVRMPLVWLLLAMASAGPFLYRLSMTRRQSLTVLILLLALLAGYRGKTKWLVPIGFAFTWLFDGFPLLLGVCGAMFLGMWWEHRRPTWGLILYPALGVLLGNVIHPYFPNNLIFSYLHMLPKVFQLVGLSHSDEEIRVGNEWYPYNQGFLIESSWLALLMVPLGLVPILLDLRPSRLRRLDGMTIGLGIIAITFLVLYMRSRRWVEAEPVFATLFCAAAWSRALPHPFEGWRSPLLMGRWLFDAAHTRSLPRPLPNWHNLWLIVGWIAAAALMLAVLSLMFAPTTVLAIVVGVALVIWLEATVRSRMAPGEAEGRDRVETWIRTRLLPRRAEILLVVIGIACLPLLWDSVERAQHDVSFARNYLRYSGASKWLAENTPQGARVFATDWDDFPELFYWNTHNSYLVGLDPTYMYLYDGPLYLEWRAITRGQVERPSEVIAVDYDAGWVFSDLEHDAFLRRAQVDPNMVEVYRDRYAIVFAIRGWHPRP
jgi:hypothetical protein